MGPGSDCPAHLVRYPTADSVAKLAARFGLPNEPWMQDWEVEVADFSRVQDFLRSYDDPELSDDDRFLLIELIVASLDAGARAGVDIGPMWQRTRRILIRKPRLHAATLSYWACGDDDDPEHQFAITPRVRMVWWDLLATPAVLADE